MLSSAGLALGLTALSATSAVSAQESSPPPFTLPEPTPSPTPAPQGPEDERSGVPIAPRTIPEDAPEAEETEAPQPQPAQPAPSEPAPSAVPLATVAEPAGEEPEGKRAPQTTPSPRRRAVSASATTIAPAAAPSAEPILEGDDGTLRSDEWVDLAPAGIEPVTPAAPIEVPTPAPSSTAFDWFKRIDSPWLVGLVAALSALLAMVASLAWRARKNTGEPHALEDTLARNVRTSIAPRQSAPALTYHAGEDTGDAALDPRSAPSQTPAISQTEKPLAAPQIEVSLHIINATRSVMMFSLEYQLTLRNRSDGALRDVRVSAQLACAMRGISASPLGGEAEVLSTVSRIGPHQSQSITGSSQMALRDVHAMHQGAKPLFVPLLHLAFDGPGMAPTQRTFVIGSPSQTGLAKLHPLPLDTPPGGIEGLRANEIRDPSVSQPA